MGLWLLLSVVYGVVLWLAGGFPLIPGLLNLEAQPAAAAERMLALADGSGGERPAVAVESTPAPTPTATTIPSRTPTLPPSVTPLPVSAAPNAPLWARNVDSAPLWSAADDDAVQFTTV